MLVGLKDIIKKWVYRMIPPPLTNESFSQAGEDCCIDFLFSQLNLRKPVYLELGVCDPIFSSNTYRFYKHGSRGVLVEADSKLIDKIRSVRPKDTIINTGVGPQGKSEAEFYVFEIASHNTFNKEEADFRMKTGNNKLLRVDKVPLMSVNDIIVKYMSGRTPDLLSVDIEGLDLAVLESIDYSKHPIPVICAETCEYTESHIKPKNRSIENMLKGKGYFVYADTYINTIFVNEKWFHNHQTK